MHSTAIVTGSAGFLGYHLCHKLLKSGYHVIGVDNYLTGSLSNTTDLLSEFPQAFRFIQSDISQPWSWLEKLKLTHVDQIFHFASVASPELFGKYALEILAANSTGLKNALEAADLLRARVIFASTSEIYGSAEQKQLTETNWGYVNCYGERACYDEAKRFGEALIYSHNQKHETTHGIVRIFNTYGPRMNAKDQRVINHFINNALAGENLVIFGEGQQTRSFCFVTDLIQAIFLYAQKSVVQPVNIGNDSEISILDVAKLIQHLIPGSSKIVFSNKRIDDPIQRRPDLSLAFTVLESWRPHIPLTEGIQITKSFIAGEKLNAT